MGMGMGSSLDAMLSISIFSRFSWARRGEDERDKPRSMASGEAIFFLLNFVYIRSIFLVNAVLSGHCLLLLLVI